MKDTPLLFAFWRYDRFPYVLGSKCHPPTNMHGVEMVYVPSYGGYFEPIKLMSIESGEALNDKLNSLKSEKLQAELQLNNTFRRKVGEIAKFI